MNIINTFNHGLIDFKVFFRENYIIIDIILLIILILLVNYETIQSITVHPKIKEKFQNNIQSENNKLYLWTYWELLNDATEIPGYIKLCFDIMKRNGSKYFNIVILNEKTVFDYLPNLRKDINDLPIALKTDYIRVLLLYTYGGVWMDADTIMMTDLKKIVDLLNNNTDFIGFGCTGTICKDNDGYGRPSNGVMGSIKYGQLISRCLKHLDNKLNQYYNTSKQDRKDFNYFELGKMIIWQELAKLIQHNPKYKYYHIPSYADGTRDKNGYWVAPELINDKNIELSNINDLQVVMLANSFYCGKDPKYNWFCKLNKNQILNNDYFVTTLFKQALSYNVINL